MKKKIIALVVSLLFAVSAFPAVAFATSYPMGQHVGFYGTYVNGFTTTNSTYKTAGESWTHFYLLLSKLKWDDVVNNSDYYAYAYACSPGGTRCSTKKRAKYGSTTYYLNDAGIAATTLHTRFTKDSGIGSSVSVYVEGEFYAANVGNSQAISYFE